MSGERKDTSNGVQSDTRKPVQVTSNVFTKLGDTQHAPSWEALYRNMSDELEHTFNVVQSDTSKPRLRVLSHFPVFSPKALVHGDRIPLIGTQPPQKLLEGDFPEERNSAKDDDETQDPRLAMDATPFLFLGHTCHNSACDTISIFGLLIFGLLIWTPPPI